MKPGRWPPGEGEMARLIREHDWAETPLGPTEGWPQGLKALVDLVLASESVMCLMWGERAISIYNDAYASAIGARHPGALGRPAFETWADARPVFEPLFERAYGAGETAAERDLRFSFAGDVPSEEAWFDLTYTPVPDERGNILGVLATLAETTDRVLAVRELADTKAMLEESERRYRAFVSASSDVVYRMGPDWAELRPLDGRGFVSDTAEPTEDWLERYIHPDDRTHVEAAIEEAVRTKGDFELEHRVLRVDGTLGWTLSRAVPILDERGEVLEWLGTASDVTARKEAEESLQESEVRRHLALNAAGMGTFLWFPQEDRGEPDARMLELFGLGPGDALNLAEALGKMIHPDDRELYAAAVAEAIDPKGDGKLYAEVRVVRPDETLRWIAVTAQTVFEGENPQATRMYGTAADVTERKRAEEERERLRALEASAHAEAAERERISRELHDRVAHHMGVAHQSLELFAALREAAPERAAERLDLARETTRLALDQTRALSAELKRLQEEELGEGMEAAFRALAEGYVLDDVRVDISFIGEESKVPNAIAMQIYLAMREAIRNAVRHSGCSRIGITVEVADGEIHGLVEDDGDGFDQEAVEKATPSWGVGLRSMRERAEMLGGSLRIDSGPGNGTRVAVKVPLDGWGA